MSTNKIAYLADRVGVGCSIEHIAPAETSGDITNTGGRIMDVHKIPEKEPSWDAIHNHDLNQIAQRIISLEKKVGELGYDPTSPSGYVAVPKMSNNPEYIHSFVTNRSLATRNASGTAINTPIGDLTAYLAAGNTHSDSLVLLDRAIQEIVVRAGLKNPTPVTPASQTLVDNFDGTYKQGETVAITQVTPAVLAAPNGPLSDVSATIDSNTVEVDETFPHYYNKLDSHANAIARLDYNIYTEIANLQAQINALTHFLSDLFSSVNSIKEHLFKKGAIRIEPIFDIDDNGLPPDTVTRVTYDSVIIKDINGNAGTAFSADTDVASTITGITVQSVYPFAMTIDFLLLETNLPTGDPASIDLTVTAYDDQGNFTTATLTDRPF